MTHSRPLIPAFAAVAKVGLHLFITTIIFVGCQGNFDRKLQREAAEITRNQCPQEPEPGTRMDSVSYDPQARVLSFYYSLSPENEQVFRENAPLLHATLVERLMNDVDYKSVKDEGVTFRYHYRSQQNYQIVYETTITAAEYKAQPSL